MLLRIAILTIQRQVKDELKLSKIPAQASAPSIKKLLAEMGFTEPHDREHCTTIATMIIDQYQEANRAMTVVEPVEETIESTDWSKELINESGVEPAEEPDLLETNNSEKTQNPDSSLTYPVDNAKREMVAYKASEMGLTLAVNEIEVIASHVNTVSSSFAQTIRDIETELTAYIAYQQSQEADDVDAMLGRVSNRMAEKNASSSQYLATGLNKVSTALEVAEQRRKTDLSNLTTAIRERLKHQR
jgi:hypothetical protein